MLFAFICHPRWCAERGRGAGGPLSKRCHAKSEYVLYVQAVPCESCSWWALWQLTVGEHGNCREWNIYTCFLPLSLSLHGCSFLRGGEGTADWDTVASSCSTGNRLSNFNKRISSKSSTWDIWARWGFPTVSSTLPDDNATVLICATPTWKLLSLRRNTFEP